MGDSDKIIHNDNSNNNYNNNDKKTYDIKV